MHQIRQSMRDQPRVPHVGKGGGNSPDVPLARQSKKLWSSHPQPQPPQQGQLPGQGLLLPRGLEFVAPLGRRLLAAPPTPPPHMWAGVSRDRGVPGSGEALRRNSGEGRRGLHGHSAWRWPQGRAAGALSRGGGGKRISPRDPWRAEVSQAGPGQVAKGTWPSRRRGRSPGEPLWTFSPPRESLEGKGAEFGEGARLPRGGPCLPWQRPLGHINPPVTPPTPQPGDLP